MTTQKRQAPYEGLSKRAVEILRLLAEGMSDREIAERLVMTINTVKWYNRQVYSILGVGSRTQAIARAHELQLLDTTSSSEAAAGDVYHLPKHNLPVETTRFIGRRHELAECGQLLDTAHLLTLVGPPGTGKTRLALQLGWEMLDSFRDGVYFVSLAPLTDPAQVMNTVAIAIGVKEAHGQSFTETLKHVLRASQMLLILDNFEHLLPAATEVSELLSAAPQLRVLATSREPLHLYGEQEYAVPPLRLPDMTDLDPQSLADCEATALFMQQARAVRSDFQLTAENAPDIARICVHLEGLPLAIELAAARIKLLTPQALLARLTNRLDTLTGGAHDLPQRQQTLRDTIAWSYNLLDDDEKTLFARLAVFQGGCSLEAIETVCGEGLYDDVFDGLTSLVTKSLIQQKETPAGEPRFTMLETLHEYAWERLRESGEAQAMHRRHAEYFAQMAEQAEPELRRAGFPYWMSQLESEDSNLHTALEWSLENEGDIELGLRLVASLRDFWIMSSRFLQAEGWSQRALARSATVPPRLRIKALTTAGIILYYSSHQPALQKQLLKEAIELARVVDDRSNLAWALIFMGIASVGQAPEYEEALATAEKGLALFRALDDKPSIAQALNTIGELARIHGDDERAQAVYEECLLVVRETGEVRREAMILNNLGMVMMHRKQVQQAKRLFKEALAKRLKVGHDKRGSLTNILFLAGAIAAAGDPQRGARLAGAVTALLEAMGVGLEPGDQPEQERILAAVRGQLDEDTFQTCWEEGRAFTLEQAAAYALDDA